MVLTNVQGIFSRPCERRNADPSLNVSETEKLIEQKIISGGMIPKVKACIDALEGGVQKAHIIDAASRTLFCSKFLPIKVSGRR